MSLHINITHTSFQTPRISASSSTAMYQQHTIAPSCILSTFTFTLEVLLLYLLFVFFIISFAFYSTRTPTLLNDPNSYFPYLCFQHPSFVVSKTRESRSSTFRGHHQVIGDDRCCLCSPNIEVSLELRKTTTAEAAVVSVTFPPRFFRFIPEVLSVGVATCLM